MPRLVRLHSALVLVLSVLVVRLGFLQLLRGADYRRLAEQNWLRLIPEQAPRGLIVDHRGIVMASNRTIFRVAVVPQEVEDLPTMVSVVSAVTHRPVEALQRTLDRERSVPFLPAVMVTSVPKEVALRLEEERWHLPGLLVRTETVRDYPLGTAAAHLVGYLSQPTAEELSLLKYYGVRPKHLVGRAGLERLLDPVLRGRSGGLMVQVNHRGHQVRVIGRRPPESGERVTLTLDAQLQSLIETAFGHQAGACVVLDPRTGAVRAMASLPSFPPDAFLTQDPATLRQLLTDPDTPLMNRATVGAYQPGSIMKLVTATAAFGEHLITSSTTISCAGALTIGDRTFHCWNREGHGSLAFPQALMQSCNVYFMTVGRRLGAARLRGAMEQCGLSRRTGWPMEEQTGHLPRRSLTPGEVGLLAIGQGEILLTPVQAAVMVSALANGGWLVEPWVVERIGDRSMAGPPMRHRLPWSPETLKAVRAGMEAVVQDPSGTGHGAFSPHITIAGKTGTAQTHVPGKPHGWFVGFCPVDAPQVAIAIVAEHGGSGGDLPARIAKTICEYVNVSQSL